MSLQDAKDKIDGYHTLASLGVESVDDIGDAVNNFIASIGKTDAKMADELYDYACESLKKFNLV